MSGREFIYPYTVTSKYRQFPWRWHFKNARFFRFYVYAAVLSLPFFAKLDVLHQRPANREEWRLRREARNHTNFDVPKELEPPHMRNPYAKEH